MKEVPDYFNRANKDLLKFIPKQADTVLEIGCGAGALANEYRKINQRATYYGVELCEEAAAYALEKGRIDKLLAGDVEKVNLSELEIRKGSIDCIIYGDVLEHLIDPWSVLKQQCQYLKENGIIVACIPNVAHYSILLNLMQGNWRYQMEGLLDKSHLRFFTLGSIKYLFTTSGLSIENIYTICLNLDTHNKFKEAMKTAVDTLGINPEIFDQNTKVFQYIIIAKIS